MEVNAFGNTQINESDLLKFKTKVSQANKILFFRDWVYLVNGKRYDNYGGTQVERARENQYRRLSPQVREWFSSVSGYSLPEKKQFKLIEEQEVIDTPEPAEENIFDIPDTPKEKATATIKWLDNISEEVVEKYSEQFNEPPESIRLEAQRCADWVRSKGGRPKNYEAQFRNWLRSPIRQITKPNGTNHKVLDISHLGDGP